jgi:putative selenium metabolism hydrolase
MSTDIHSAIQSLVAHHRDDMIRFLREIVAIPSPDGEIKDVGQRVAQEMERLHFDEVRFDRMGNVLGRVGHGRRVLLYDSHLDHVGIGNPAAWQWDPYKGKIENGILYARGACDEKGSTPGMVYALAILKQLGLAEDWTLYYFGNMEEACEGIAPNELVEVEGIKPDYVVIGEPTKLNVYRGQRGRLEMKVVAKGRSAHAASFYLGDNAVYTMLPIIAGVRDMQDRLGDDPFLGKGGAAVTKIECQTASLNAVPDECTIYIDRRLSFGESKEAALAQVKALRGADHAEVSILRYDRPSYTGYVFPVEEYYPAWAIPADHVLVQAGQAAYRAAFGREPVVGKWNFSTNGVYWTGKAGIPSIGFGPGDEIYAHTVNDQVPLDDVVYATLFYALLPAMIG